EARIGKIGQPAGLEIEHGDGLPIMRLGGAKAGVEQRQIAAAGIEHSRNRQAVGGLRISRRRGHQPLAAGKRNYFLLGKLFLVTQGKPGNQQQEEKCALQVASALSAKWPTIVTNLYCSQVNNSFNSGPKQQVPV